MRGLLAVACVLALLGLSACGTAPAGKSALFRSVIADSLGGTLRGVNLGMPVQEVLKREAGSPKHQDSLGLTWDLRLGGQRSGTLEYFTQPGDSIVVSMVVNLVLDNELEARDFCTETEAWLRGRYGVPDGTPAHYTWLYEDENLEVHLRTLDNPRALSLNFARIR